MGTSYQLQKQALQRGHQLQKQAMQQRSRDLQRRRRCHRQLQNQRQWMLKSRLHI